MKRTFLPHAMAYAEQGFQILPITSNGKIPLLKQWPERATRDPEIIQGFWATWSEANLGIATGAGSGCFVLDVDVKNGQSGRESLAALEAEHGPLPETLRARTPSGGGHLYFRCPPGEKLGNRTGIRPGLDLRVERGYVVAPPSLIDGVPYAWENEGTPLADAPDWLLALIQEGPKPTAPGGAAVSGLTGVAEGRRNDTVFRYAARLLTKGMSYDEAKLLVLAQAAACDPPLPEDEARRCLDSAYGRYAPTPQRPLTELGNAERLVDCFGAFIRYLPAYNHLAGF